MTQVINISQTAAVQGGSDIYFRSLSRLLSEQGYSVDEFHPDNSNRAMPREIDLNRPSPRDLVRYFYNREAREKLGSRLDQVDIAHLQIYYGKLTTSILDELSTRNIPTVQTLHEYKLVCPVHTLFNRGASCLKCKGGAYFNALTNRCNRGSVVRSGLSMAEQYFSEWRGARSKVDHFITVSDWQKQRLVEMGMDESRLTTLHNFVFTEDFQAQAFRGDYFLFFGRLEPKKGLFTLLQAASFLKREYGLSIPIRIVGRGSAGPDLQDYCHTHGLNDVVFFDFCDAKELQRHIAGAIACLLPSLWGETFGLALIESMVLERPAIISATGGMLEVIDHEKEGLIVAPGSAEELGRAMLRFYHHPDEARTMGRAGRERVESQFSAVAHFQGLEQIYRQVLSR